MIHTSFYTGSKIRIVLKNGDVIIDKYKESKTKRIICVSREYNTNDIKSISYYKPLKHELK